jgi:glycosyltransferase involved in cell wall biosynthesis
VNVCFATYPTAFQQPGGGEVVILALKEALERRGVNVELFDPWTTRLRTVDVLHYFSSNGTDLFPLIRDHVHLVVTPTIWPELPTNVRLQRELTRAARALVRRPRPGPYDAADLVLPHSRREADLLSRNYHVPRSKLRIVPHGTDLRFAAPATGVFARLHGLRDYVLCPGRIDANKNQLRLIRALRDTDIDLVILGAPMAGEEAYVTACRAAAGPRTHFVEPLEPGSELLVDAVASAACVTIASVYEIWSLAAHEAGVAGTPIAASSGGVLEELLSPYAVFFDPHSEEAIRAAVDEALARGRVPGQSEHFAARFSWDAAAEHVHAAYASVVSGEHPPAGAVTTA